jgi:hypothetical protein
LVIQCPDILHHDIRHDIDVKEIIFGILNDFNFACYADGHENHPISKQYGQELNPYSN